MIVKTAEFVMSNTDYKLCPDIDIPEYAFIGRSNVGKSSLINMLCNIKDLAKTSSKPGKTQLINHFSINSKEWFLVDLPGYGYAVSSKVNKLKWKQMIDQYLRHRTQLSNLFVLIDSRLSPQKIDLEFISELGKHNIPFCIVFTKTDKEKQSIVDNNVNLFKKSLLENWDELPPIFLSSSKDGRGKEDILAYIEKVNIILGEQI